MTDRQASRPGRVVGLLIAALLLMASARAGAADREAKERAKRHYDQGVIEYNLGRFQTAISELSKAYELDPEPILLFNIAQAHRRLGNREQAIFFYKRYLASEPSPAKADEVRRRITELEAKLEAERAAAAALVAPAPATPGPREPVEQAPAQPPPAADPAAEVPARVTSVERRPSDRGLDVSLSAGVAQPLFPAGEFTRPMLPAAEIDVSYAARSGLLGFAGGLAVPYVRIPYTPAGGQASRASHVIGPMLSAAIRLRWSEAVEIRGQAAAGLLWWTGLGPENPFREGEGAVSMGGLRLSAELRWRPSARLFLGLGPSYLVSTASDAFSGSLSRLALWGLLGRVGAGL